MFYKRYMFVVNNLCFKTKKEAMDYIKRYNKKNHKKFAETDIEVKLIDVHMVSVKEISRKRKEREGSH